MDTIQEAIIVNSLVKDFKGFIAVDGVSFQVQAGEIFGFLVQTVPVKRRR